MTSVKATNNHNEAFGIEMNKVYQAEKVEKTYTSEVQERWGAETITTTAISWNVNGSNYQEEDFEEV